MINGYYCNPMYGNDYYNYPPVSKIGPKQKKESNIGGILAGTAAVATVATGIYMVKKGKLNGAKEAITNLWKNGVTKVKEHINTEKITKYQDATKKFFTEGKGQRVWNPIKNTYQYVKGFFSKKPVGDPFANLP